jgi:transglutaminase-like putative cysteine protease
MFFRKNISTSCSLLLLLLACAGTRTDNGPVQWPGYLKPPFPGAKEYPDDGAVILLQEGSLNIFPNEEMPQSQLDFRCITKIFNERGFDLANVTIPYSSTTKISNIQARTISADGQVTPVPRDKIFDVSIYPNFIFYADSRAKRFTFPAVAPDCIVEYRYTATVQGYTFWDSWSFQNLVPTRLSRYQITAPSEWGLKWKCSNIDLEPKTAALPAGFKQTWLWEVADMPPLIPEPGMPAWREVQPSLTFAPVGMKTWPDLGRWFFLLYKDQVQPSDDMRILVDTLCPGDVPAIERLRRLYLFVRNDIRYVAVTIGIGGYQPHPAAEVFRNRYGDCKDKVALLQAMAACAGLEVTPVLISTWQNGAVDTTVVSHTHFNHVIARARMADSSVVWMDPTSRFAPFAELPWFDRDRLVYAIGKTGLGEWQRTPAQSAADHQWRRRWELQLNSERVAAKLSSWYTGAAANDMRLALQDLREKERLEQVAREVKKAFPSADIGDVVMEHLDHEEEPVFCSISFTFPLAAGDHVSLSQFGDMDIVSSLNASRTHALQFRHPQVLVDSIVIRTGDFWSAETKSTAVQLVHPCASYQYSIDRSSAGLVLVKQFILDQPLIPLSDYPSFYAMLRKMAETDRGAVTLQPAAALKNN